MMDARLIQAGFLSKENIWKTDLDILWSHRDRMVMLSFMTASPVVNSSFLSTAIPTTVSAPRRLAVSLGIDQQINETGIWGTLSAEFLSYAIALFVYAVRYPAVFWNTNKWFSVLFSFQLFVNGFQSILLYTGVSILYKIHVLGPSEMVSLVRHIAGRAGLGSRLKSPFILNTHVTLALFAMSTILLLFSSHVLYLYGYGRFNAFLNREKARQVISIRESDSSRGWGYFTHCAALSVLLAVVVCEAPLVYDFSLVYRGSLDIAVLVSVLGAILHVFLWVLLWLILTIKQEWVFKVRVTIGRAAVRSAKSIKLVTDVDLIASTAEGMDAPLLVVGGGTTYTVTDTSPKKAIMSLVKSANSESNDKSPGKPTTLTDDGEEQIYWLRPKSRTPKGSPDSESSDRMGWLTNKSCRVAVDFNQKSDGEVGKKKNRQSGNFDDDGDYARLRELPPFNGVPAPTEQSEDTGSEDNKLLDRVRDESVTYASNKHPQPHPKDYEDPSPLLTPEPQDDYLPPPPPISPEPNSQQNTSNDSQRADSGMAQEELTPRSDSISTVGSGGSPPDCNGSNSESSSGVHSNSSHSSGIGSQGDKNGIGSSSEAVHRWKANSLQNKLQAMNNNMMNMVNSRHSLNEPLYSSGVYRPQQIYAATNKGAPVINEVAEENTVVIRRKPMIRPKTAEIYQQTGPRDAFGRSTNIRLTSFMDLPDSKKSISTMPHFPTQPMGVSYPVCSTMPLPAPNHLHATAHLDGGVSYSSFPRPRQHTTIPVHHNGVRLFNPNSPCKRILPQSQYQVKAPLRENGHSCPMSNYSHNHHTFPQLPINVESATMQHDSNHFNSLVKIESTARS
nr:PREDICTED: protein tincar-like isoform X2 [Bemisia tabaci]